MVKAFFFSVLIFYIFSLWLHNNILTKRIEKLNRKNKRIKKKLKRKSKLYKEIRSNRDGLVNQYHIDLNDKRILEKRLSQQKSIITILIQSIPSNEISNTSEKIKLLKELSLFEQDNENSKNT